MDGYVLLKRKAGLFGFNAGVICYPVNSFVFFFRRRSHAAAEFRHRFRKLRCCGFILGYEAGFFFAVHTACLNRNQSGREGRQSTHCQTSGVASG